MPAPVLATADPLALEELTRVTALAGVAATVVHDVPSVRRAWDSASLVLLGEDLLADLAATRPPRRDGVVVLGTSDEDAGLWQRAVDVGAERVVFLPQHERWLVDALADASEGRAASAPLVAVLGGRGGAGATALAGAVAVAAARDGRSVVLVDGDPLGGGVDVLFGAEGKQGLRWPDLSTSRGRLPAEALTRALPVVDGVALLSWDRSDRLDLPVEAARAVLAAARRSHDLVVVDVARHLDEVGREVVLAATCAVLVVPAEVRACASAARVAAQVSALCRDLRLVVRGPAPAGLEPEQLAEALGLPLALVARHDPRLARALEDGIPPGSRRGSPLAQAARTLLDDVLGPANRQVA